MNKHIYKGVTIFKTSEGYEIKPLPAVFSTIKLCKYFIDMMKEKQKKKHL